MAERFDDWDGVVAFALSLPDTEMASFYGTPCPKVNGKAFVSPGREPGSFHVMSPHDEKAVLLETDPDSFWQTAHYANWPGLLVRYGAADPDRIADVIRRAWWDRAKKPQRLTFGPRP
ncbi:MmcQ/YjbR family DNA-binding protein [Sphingomonas sp.]|uniref:MmcQ/YjbR family DNA-binding protein n=1 Tax=Sphingomonas sp. TaxID=28214 RepID=UPI002BCF375C|nr:MmcQ/YjbR family DNA-binding protein [Sphingomonas sp.]HWK35775.1 MmcQ/YjbR family DNA-binding protein [Sphingomonas sp.]